MNYIKLIRLLSPLHSQNKELMEEDNAFIDEINDSLALEGFILDENAENPVAEVVFVESGGSEPLFKKMFPNLQKPVYLISSCRNNSLPASLEIRSFLEYQKIDCYLFFGESEEIGKNLLSFMKSYVAMRNNKGTRLGVIGRPSDWLIASKMDKKKVKEMYDIDLINIPLTQLYSEIDQKILFEDLPHLEDLLKQGVDSFILQDALNIYCALKRIIKKYDLKGFTIRCFDMLGKYHNTACLALALLNEEGYIASCEGDVAAMITMHFIRLLTDEPSFQANPSYANIGKREILFAHCTLPLNMCKKYSLDTHFESGLGIGIRGELELRKISILKISPDLNLDNCLATSGVIINNPHLKNYCRTQITVKVDDKGFIDTLFANNYGNHVVITYADCITSFFNLLNLYEQRYQIAHHIDNK